MGQYDEYLQYDTFAMHHLTPPLDYRQFGVADGRPVIYFHGTPGAPDECEIFDLYGKTHHLNIICYDRSTIDPQLQGAAYYRRIADDIADQTAGKPVDVIGFSIGAFIALQVCRAMNGNVRSLHLVSAAAPLDAGNFIDLAAGKTVFRLAQCHPSVFLGLARLQGLMAMAIPGWLFSMLFSNARGEDRALATDRAFRMTITRALKTCLRHPQAYARDIEAYVQPWKESLSDIAVNTFIWHGAKDNWSPVSMAIYLESALPNCSKITILDELSHYSCLYRTTPTICESIENFE